ncbi:MAG: GHKL domain-containing protein [Eubacteriales bacterium]|nr:GHKL domain-containing protein [Eubacteriales bacterium]
MIETFLAVLNFAMLLFFGIYVSAGFIGIERNRKNALILCCFGLVCFGFQTASVFVLGMETTEMLYPVITHLPLLGLFTVYYKEKLLPAILAIMAGYLCCQITKWFGVIALELSGQMWLSYIVRMLLTFPIAYFIDKYASSSVMLILSKKKRSILIFGIIPFSYYVFDYAVTVYTKILYSGSQVIFEFLPFVLCIAYLVFSVIYFKEYEQKCEAERYTQVMEIQKSHSLKEIESIRRSEYEIALVRHDMRHFLNNILSYVENGNNERAAIYIKDIINTADRTVIKKFCRNELVNMVISSYEHKMSDNEIVLLTNVEIPETLPCSEVEFTSILANGLENAINAVSLLDIDRREITLDMRVKDDKLLLSIKNPCSCEPEIINGLPVAKENGHGFGVQSIKYVTSKLKGNCQFTAKDGIFALRVVL